MVLTTINILLDDTVLFHCAHVVYSQVRIYAHLVNFCDVPQNKVSVLSQYRAQCSEITRNLEDVYGFKRPNVSTVIASQGMDHCVLS